MSFVRAGLSQSSGRLTAVVMVHTGGVTRNCKLVGAAWLLLASLAGGEPLNTAAEVGALCTRCLALNDLHHTALRPFTVSQYFSVANTAIVTLQSWLIRNRNSPPWHLSTTRPRRALSLEIRPLRQDRVWGSIARQIVQHRRTKHHLVKSPRSWTLSATFPSQATIHMRVPNSSCCLAPVLASTRRRISCRPTALLRKVSWL